MMSISQATQNYFEKEFAEAQERYLSASSTGAMDREVVGALAPKLELEGKLTREQYARLCQGQDPRTGEQLIRIQKQREYVNDKGKTVKPAKHRPGWDVTFSAPKSVSDAALVGEDQRLLNAHREAVRETLVEVESFIQAKLGNTRGSRTTGSMLAVQFEHDSARPVDGFAAPQLHTHNFIMNMTRTAEDGEFRALEMHDIYRVQRYFTTTYRQKLAERVLNLGYEIEATRNGAWELSGYTRDYLDAISLRSKARDERLKEKGLKYSPRAAEVAILDTREKKVDYTHEEIRAMWETKAAEFGHQAQQVIGKAQERAPSLERSTEFGNYKLVREAVDFALERETEREAVLNETLILTEAMKYDIGKVKLEDVKREVATRILTGELVQVSHRRNTPEAALTTPEMLALEQHNIERMEQGKGGFDPIASIAQVEREIRRYNHQNPTKELNPSQEQAVRNVLSTQDQIVALEGKAGVGKTTVLRLLGEAAHKNGYQVEGFAPTGKASQLLLKEAGIPSRTLQSFIATPARPDDQAMRLYVLDEAGMAGSRDVSRMLDKLKAKDRIIFLGDQSQHLSVSAGTPLAYLAHKGMQTVEIDHIIRQKNPELREAVSMLAGGKVKDGLDRLSEIDYDRQEAPRQAAVVEIEAKPDRLAAMVNEFGRDPDHTLCVCPDNKTRAELNVLMHGELQRQGRINAEERQLTILVSAGDFTAADKKRAASYETGQVVRYTSQSEQFGKGEYARVVSADRERNHITVEKETGEQISYTPRRLSGVEVYREEERRFSVGDRIQFTSQDKERKISNRELGTITGLSDEGAMIQLDGKDQAHRFHPHELRHIDLGYTLTSYSSQGQTVERVLVEANTEERATLLNQRMAYVSVSRATSEAILYTNNQEELPEAMNRSLGKTSAREALEQTDASQLTSLSKQAFPNETRLLAERKRFDRIEAEWHNPELDLARIKPVDIEARLTEQLEQRRILEPNLEQWKAVREHLLERNTARVIDLAHDQGQLYADEQGRAIFMTRAGRVRMLDFAADQVQECRIDPKQAEQAIAAALNIRAVERHQEVTRHQELTHRQPEHRFGLELGL